MSKINDNGTLRDMTAEEQTQFDADQANSVNEKSAEEKIAEREAVKSSAKAKLIAGEPLTEEEADTVVI
ncbi:hypothetical protein [uncultured Mediterranean phage uvMED]|nr:hypothetical protein [uncultured Mediterranean phage uvMED]